MRKKNTHQHFLLKELSAMIRGIPEDVALVVDYKEEDVDDLLREFLKSC